VKLHFGSLEGQVCGIHLTERQRESERKRESYSCSQSDSHIHAPNSQFCRKSCNIHSWWLGLENKSHMAVILWCIMVRHNGVHACVCVCVPGSWPLYASSWSQYFCHYPALCATLSVLELYNHGRANRCFREERKKDQERPKHPDVTPKNNVWNQSIIFIYIPDIVSPSLRLD